MQIVSGAGDVERTVDTALDALMMLGRVMRQRVPGDTIDSGTFWLLKNLSVRGALRVTDLAGCVNLDTSTVSRHLTHLQREGLIDRTPDPDDGRAQRVAISDQGRRLLEDGFGRRRALLSRSLQGWTGADLAELSRLLARFADSVDHHNNPDHPSADHPSTLEPA